LFEPFIYLFIYLFIIIIIITIIIIIIKIVHEVQKDRIRQKKGQNYIELY